MSKQLTRMILAVTTVLWVGVAAADEHAHMHSNFAPDIDAFHSLLAPAWHARPGKERTRNACAKAGDLEKSALEIRSTDATPLVAAIARLKSTCQDQPAAVDTAFIDVHEAFHRLLDAPASVAVR